MSACTKNSSRWASSSLCAVYLMASIQTGAAGALMVGGGVITSSDHRGAPLTVIARRCARQMSLEWRLGDHGLVATEELVADGTQWSRYTLIRKNLGVSFEAAREGDRVDVLIRHDDDRVFQRKRLIGMRKTVLVGPTLAVFLHENLTTLRHGTSLAFEFLVVDQSMILSLRARSMGYGTDGGIRVKVESALPLMRPFVPTTVLSFSPDGRLTSLTGIVPLQGGTARQPTMLEASVLFGPEVTEPLKDECMVSRLAP